MRLRHKFTYSALVQILFLSFNLATIWMPIIEFGMPEHSFGSDLAWQQFAWIYHCNNSIIELERSPWPWCNSDLYTYKWEWTEACVHMIMFTWYRLCLLTAHQIHQAFWAAYCFEWSWEINYMIPLVVWHENNSNLIAPFKLLWSHRLGWTN